MMRLLHLGKSLLLPIALTTGLAAAQALPTADVPPSAEGFQLPKAEGTLRYSLTASELINRGLYLRNGTTSSTTLSGNLAYLSNSKSRPTTVTFSGGFSGSTSSAQPSNRFFDLSLSQVLSTRLWNLVVTDSSSYLPQTAIGGLSGVPGTGDLGVVQGSNSSQAVLTTPATRISNTTSGSLGRKLTGSTSISGTGSYSILRFLGDGTGGVESNSIAGGGGISHRINALNSISGSYAYTESSFSASKFSFSSQSATVAYTRQFSRKVSAGASVGPQRISGSGTGLVAPSWILAGGANVSYTGQWASGSIGYSRGSNNGSGTSQGAVSDSISSSAHRTFGRAWATSITLAYSRSSGLPGLVTTGFSTNTIVGGFQLSRPISRNIFAYTSYTGSQQSSQGTTAANNFAGLSQVIGFGLSYSSSSIHLGQ